MSFSLPLQDSLQILSVLVVLILVVQRLARRIGLPPIVGLILAGVIVGTHGIGLIDITQGVEFFSTTGLLYIMFIAGLEIDLSQVRRHPHPTVVFGGFTFAIPWVSGVLMGHYLFGFSWLTSILLGSLFSSHTLLPYPAVSKFGLARDPAVTAVVGGTILTDTLALLVLAITARIHRGELSLVYGLELALGGGVLIALSIYFLPRFGRWFYRNLPIGEDTAEFLFLFANLLVFSVAAHLAGLEPIIGAFLAGMSLNPLVPEKSRLLNRVQFVGDTIFIPIFLLSVGMMVDLRSLLLEGLGWEIAVGMTIALLVSKLLAAVATGTFFRYTREQTGIVYGLSVNQAAATLAAVMVGHEIGLLSDAVLNGTILMILASCLAGPWLTDIFARRHALGQSPTRGAAVGVERILMPMLRTVEVPPLMDLVALIRTPSASHPVYPLSVAIEGPGVEADLAQYEKLLGQAVVQGAATDIPVRAETRIDTNEASGIERAVRELRITCLVCSWDGVASRHAVFGRILDQVMAQVRCLIVVAHLQQSLNTFRRIVVLLPPLDDRLPGFAEAVKAVKNTVTRADLGLLVIGPSSKLDSLRQEFEPLPPDTTMLGLDRTSAQWSILEKHLQADDLLVPFSCRRDSLAWQPVLDHLPQRLRERFPAQSLLFVYPAEIASWTVSEDWDTEPSDRELRPILDIERFIPHLEAQAGGEAVREQLRRYLENVTTLSGNQLDRRLDRLTKQLLPSVLEIQPGLVILHVHSDVTAERIVLLGTQTDGIYFPEIANPCHAMFILISPEDSSPDEHLRTLGDLARLIMHLPPAEALAQLDHGAFAQLLQKLRADGTV